MGGRGFVEKLILYFNIDWRNRWTVRPASLTTGLLLLELIWYDKVPGYKVLIATMCGLFSSVMITASVVSVKTSVSERAAT